MHLSHNPREHWIRDLLARYRGPDLGQERVRLSIRLAVQPLSLFRVGAYSAFGLPHAADFADLPQCGTTNAVVYQLPRRESSPNCCPA